jgi:alginate O-acetyltransferase complex protein AlgI
MLFNSFEFIFLFLPAGFAVYFFLSKQRFTLAAKTWLLLASLFFYSWWDVRFLPVILISILFNYALGTVLASGIPKSRTREMKLRRPILVFGIAGNLALLGFYKYSDFLILNLNALLHTNVPLLNLPLPLGISFFTFTQVVFLCDAYSSETVEPNFLNYALFVVFFPHLLAGPIVHHQQIMPQFENLKNKVLQYKNIFIGLFYFLIGLFQKVVIADSVAPIANTGFANAQVLSLVEAWAALFAYTLQIYFDFAGYSNMAIGLARFFNIKFPINFDSPYQATSIIDFWRRWHITLSNFLRNYLYIPLGGNRQGEMRQYVNIFITMFLGGLWHGAGWTFVIWGSYHGVLIIGNHLIRKFKISLPRFLSASATFLLVAYGWVFFRSHNFQAAMQMTQGLIGRNGIRLNNLPFVWKKDLVLIVFLLFIAWFWPNVEYWVKKVKPTPAWFLIFSIFFIANILLLNRASAFLYFQF